MLVDSQYFEDERLKVIDELRLWVAGFLGVNIESISVSFLSTFEQLRQDILAKLPAQIDDYNKKKNAHIALIRSTQTNSKRPLTMTPFIDPRVKEMDPGDRKNLLSLAGALDIDNVVPQDVAVRAVRSIRATALLLLEGKDPEKIDGISQDQVSMEKGTREIARYHNFIRRRRK